MAKNKLDQKSKFTKDEDLTKPNQARVFYFLTKRHLLVFFKNWSQILFTLMVPLAILFIYGLFLRPMEVASINNALEKMLSSDALKDQTLMAKVYGIADTWMFSGVLAVSCFTVSLNTCTIMVRDKEKEISRDFNSSPISQSIVTASYFSFNAIITFFINLIVYCVCLIYLSFSGADLPSVLDGFAIVGLILISTICASLITFFICSFIKSESTMASLVAITSASVGFLIGAYLPPNMVPKAISTITTFVPGTYSCCLIRSYFMNQPMLDLFNYASSKYPEMGENIVNTLYSQFDFSLSFFNIKISVQTMSLVLLSFIGIFIIFDIFLTPNKIIMYQKYFLNQKNDRK